MSLGSFFLLGDPHVEGEEDVDSNPDPVELPVAAIDTEGTSFRLHVLVLLFDPKCGELGCEELPLFSDLDRSWNRWWGVPEERNGRSRRRVAAPLCDTVASFTSLHLSRDDESKGVVGIDTAPSAVALSPRDDAEKRLDEIFKFATLLLTYWWRVLKKLILPSLNISAVYSLISNTLLSPRTYAL